ncbi:MAG: type II toxin-antitoxin system VapC family toxin [Verrucomicrobiales bacterium]|nr:type II toxin-antitoxin system VapC family toxin [Verrucomicrobiales bacterium]
MNLLLDTCSFLWLTREPSKLSPTAVDLINDEENLLFLSEVSIMEMVMRNSASKLPFSDPPKEWIPARLEYHQVTALPIVPDVIYLSGEWTECTTIPSIGLLPLMPSVKA